MYMCVLLCVCVCGGGAGGDGAVGMNGQSVARGGANAASSAQHYASNSHKRASTGAACVYVCLRFL